MRLILLMRGFQEAGALGISLQQEKNNQEATMFLFHTRRLTAELAVPQS